MVFRSKAVVIVLVLALTAWAGGVGAQSGERVTELSSLLSVGAAEAPLPRLVGHPAPNLSVEQMASDICVNQIDGHFWPGTVRAAYDATVRARQVRQAAARGEATDRQMMQAEIARQDAVNKLGPYKHEGEFTEARRDLKIDGLSYRRVNENTRDVLEVGFVVHNLTAARIELPPVTLLSIDEQGFVLAGQTTQLSAVFIDPGVSARFAVRFHNPPTYTRVIKPLFAPPFGVRGFRGCDRFDPLASGATARAARADTMASLPIADGAPRYTAAELALLQNWVRSFAQSAFQQPRSADTLCDTPGHRRWRDQMVVADRLDEAWVATSAVDSIRRGVAEGVMLPQDMAEAERSREQAVGAYVALQTWKPNFPPKYADLAIADVKTSQIGDRFIVDGKVMFAHGVATPAPLRISAVDRYGAVVAEMIELPGKPSSNPQGIPLYREFRVSFLTPSKLAVAIKVDFAC